MKNLIFIIAFIPALAFGQMAQRDSLSFDCVKRDTTMALYKAKSGTQFFLFYSPSKKKWYKVFVPRVKE